MKGLSSSKANWLLSWYLLASFFRPSPSIDGTYSFISEKTKILWALFIDSFIDLDPKKERIRTKEGTHIHSALFIFFFLVLKKIYWIEKKRPERIGSSTFFLVIAQEEVHMEKEKAPADENGEGAGKEAARATSRSVWVRFQSLLSSEIGNLKA